jgi:plasmid stability protein
MERSDPAVNDIAGHDGLDYCDSMKNVTVSLDDETYRKARMRAAELDTSVSALVRRYLTELGASETEFERLKRRERELRARVPAGFRAADNVSRDRVHERST